MTDNSKKFKFKLDKRSGPPMNDLIEDYPKPKKFKTKNIDPKKAVKLLSSGGQVKKRKIDGIARKGKTRGVNR